RVGPETGKTRRRSPALSKSRMSGLAVVPGEIVGYFLAVGFADGRAERLDHLGDFGIPKLPIHESRVHHDVVQAMARRAARLDFVASGAILECRPLLRGDDRSGGERKSDEDRGQLHQTLLQTTVSAMRCTTLW